MNKLLISTILVSTLSLMAGCSSMITAMSPSPMSEQEATAIVEKNQIYDTNHSFAYNICRYTTGSSGKIACAQDIQIPKAEYEKTFGADANGRVDGSYAASVGLYALSSVIQPGFFDSFSSFGPGALFLVSGLLSGNKGEEAENRFVAFVPVSKAKTKQQAIDYVYESFVKAYRKTLKTFGLEEITYTKDYATSKLGDFQNWGKALYVKNKEGCGVYKTKEGKIVLNCDFLTSHDNNHLTGEQTVIPSWMPNAGEKAWVISGISDFVTKKPYEGTLTQRDMAIEEAKGLPDNFYLLIPEGIKDGKELPPFVVSNKKVFFYAVPKN